MTRICSRSSCEDVATTFVMGSQPGDWADYFCTEHGKEMVDAYHGSATVEKVPVGCPADGCDHLLMHPEPKGYPGDDSFYCQGCGRPWSLDLKRELL